jgi:hypothetical protein
MQNIYEVNMGGVPEVRRDTQINVAQALVCGRLIAPRDVTTAEATSQESPYPLGAPMRPDYSTAAFAGDTPRWTNL